MTISHSNDRVSLIEMTTSIVASYVQNNTISPDDLPKLITTVNKALLATFETEDDQSSTELKPAVPIKKSIGADYIICLEDGKPFKSLKRHLQTHHHMTDTQYRERWGLPADYPMVAPNYASKRSNLAKKMGLGQRRGRGKS